MWELSNKRLLDSRRSNFRDFNFIESRLIKKLEEYIVIFSI